MKTHHLLLVGLAAVAAGMYLAGSTTGTGIYGTPSGSTLSNVWTSGFNLGTGV